MSVDKKNDKITVKEVTMTGIELVDIKTIKKNPTNPRTINDEKFRKLVKSIKEFPEMLKVRPIVVDDDMIVLGGNMRLKAIAKAGIKETYIIKFNNLTEDKKKEFIIKDNVGYGEWDFEMLRDDGQWDLNVLDEWALTVEQEKKQFEEEVKTRLADRFIVPPFTVLDTRQGEWQARKKDWKALIQDNGESREGTLAGNIENTKNIYNSMKGGVSLLDPVISEVICHWFLPEGEDNKIVDCFAGDSVFGFVSSYLGHKFTGIEIRKEQADLNNARSNDNATYICDDGQNVDKHVEKNSQDLLFSCPPYYDLEEYSDLENDASNQETYEDFMKIIDTAFTRAIKTLKDNRFAAIIVGDVRAKDGSYYNFHEDIKIIFQRNGMQLYNELILVEPIGLNAMRANRSMNTRKVPKVHQNVLVFFKPEENKKPEIQSLYRKVLIFKKGDEDIKNHFKGINYTSVELESE